MAKFTIETAERIYLEHFATLPPAERRGILAGLRAIDVALSRTPPESPLFDAAKSDSAAELLEREGE